MNLDAYSGDGGSSAARDQILSKRPGQTIFGDLLDDEQNGKVLNQASGRSVACIDRRGDGNYSVFVSNYASNGSPKAMLVEMTPGTSTLVDVAPELGMDTANGGRAVVAGQVYDEHVSLFVNNEGGNGGNSGRNYLYEGLAGSKFQQVASDRGVEDAGQTGRGKWDSTTARTCARDNDGSCDAAASYVLGPFQLSPVHAHTHAGVSRSLARPPSSTCGLLHASCRFINPAVDSVC